MSLLWALPGVVVVAGAVPAFVLAGRAANEAARLCLELQRWRVVSPAEARVRAETERLQHQLERIAVHGRRWKKPERFWSKARR